jgi:hypothetical protein
LECKQGGETSVVTEEEGRDDFGCEKKNGIEVG